MNAFLRLGEVQETIEVRGKGQAPVYPEQARRAGMEGTVVMRAVISTEGKLLSMAALPGADALLAEAAMEAVGRWHYRPALLNGKAEEVATTVEVRFVLE